MRLLPREHGATAIWLASFILGIIVLSDWPTPIGLSAFIAFSVLTLLVLGQLTSSSSALIKLERNRVILPVSSVSLTGLVPIGSLACTGYLPSGVIAVWTLFMTYTAGGVAYTQAAVRSVKSREMPKPEMFVLPLSAILILESVAFDMAGWLSTVSVSVVVPLYLHWMAVRRKSGEGVPVGKVIRRIGFTQAATMVAVAAILAGVTKV